jgi:hypothetical protein
MFRKKRKEFYRKPTRHQNEDAPNQGVLYTNQQPKNWTPRKNSDLRRMRSDVSAQFVLIAALYIIRMGGAVDSD